MRLVSKIYKELLKFNNKKTTQFLKSKDLNRHLRRHMANKLMKKVSTSYLWGNRKLKQQCDTTAHLLEWLKSKKTGEDVEQQELLFIAGGNANGLATLEESGRFLQS